MLRRSDLVLAVLLAAALTGGSVLAQGAPRDAFPPGAPPMPVCNAPREGVAACLAGTACLCRFEQAGSMTSRPDGFRWDCGPLRPRCDLPVAPPITAPEITVLPQFVPQATFPPGNRR